MYAGVPSATRVGDRVRDRHRLGERERPRLETRREVAAVEPLHREPRALVEEAVRDVPHDARVREVADDLRFPQEPLRVGDALEELQRDAAARRAVERPVHVSHSAHGGELLDGEALGDDLSGLRPVSLAGVPPVRRDLATK
jgi:hypothetical protein